MFLANFYLQDVPKPQDFSQFFGVLGGLIFLGAFAIFCYFKFGPGGNAPKKDSNGQAKPPKAGELDPAVWDQRIKAACSEAIKAELALPVEIIKATAQRIEVEQDRQGENQTESIGKLAEAVNKLALAIAKARGITGD